MLDADQVRGETRICIGVCTYKRPVMLRSCLSSLAPLQIPDGCALSVVVVDNDSTPTSRENVEAFNGLSEGIPFHYGHEPKRGISQARNAILDAAAGLRADWIVMIDDDQIVPIDWLLKMWSAQRETGADVVQGSVDLVYPDPLPRWAFPKQKRDKWNYDANRAATNGVLFRVGLNDKEGQPLRFSPDFDLTGAEDRDFFIRAKLGGARIVFTPEAVAREFVPEPKLTFLAQIRRAYCFEVVMVRQDRQLFGFLPTLATKSAKFSECLIEGLRLLAEAPFAANGRKKLLKGVKKLSKAGGIFAGLTGLANAHLYENIYGH